MKCPLCEVNELTFSVDPEKGITNIACTPLPLLSSVQPGCYIEKYGKAWRVISLIYYYERDQEKRKLELTHEREKRKSEIEDHFNVLINTITVNTQVKVAGFLLSLKNKETEK